MADDYKQKVDAAKQTVQEIFKSGQDKGISVSEIEDDIETYLKSQGLTSFDLKTDGFVETILEGFSGRIPVA